MSAAYRCVAAAIAATALYILTIPAVPASTREVVAFNSDDLPGTIIVRTNERRLYLVLGQGRAMVYPVGVGRAGRQWAGRSFIDGKHVKPAWAPPPDIAKERPDMARVIPGGSPDNPMGVAALTLSGGGQYAIHGTNNPGSVGGFNPSKIVSEIGGQTLLFPIAIAGRLGAAGAANFLRQGRRLSLHLGATLGGLGQRPPGRGRQRLDWGIGRIRFGRSVFRLGHRALKRPPTGPRQGRRDASAHPFYRRGGSAFGSPRGRPAMNYVRTAILLAGLTALFMGIGFLIGGQSGAMIALVVAAGMNLISYWNSDKLVLSMHGAQEVDRSTAPDLVDLVGGHAERAGLPIPRVFVMDNPRPNAFATGRNPQNAAVAVTTGLMQHMSREELAGVIAHELAHIRNHDTLIMTITATIGGAISMIAQFGMFFGGGHRDNNNGGFGVIGTIAMMTLAPIAAMLVQWRSAAPANTPPTISARASPAGRNGSPRRSASSTRRRMPFPTERRSATPRPRTYSSSIR